VDEQPQPLEPLVPDVIIARPVTAAPVAPTPPRSPLELASLSRGAAGGGLALILLILLAMLSVEVAAQVLFARPGSQPGPAVWQTVIIADKCVGALLALAGAALCLRLFRLTPAAFGLRMDRLGGQTAWGLAAFCGVYAAFAISMVGVLLLVLAVPSFKEDLAARGEFMELLPVHSVTGAILLLVPVAIQEELVFRGLLIPFLRRVGCPWAVAVFVSAAVFASLHIGQGWLAIPQVFCIAVALGTFFVLSRSLIAVMVAHFLFDFLQLQLIRALSPWVEQALNQT
jgi:membrane protease YdiL (CAAX protease family)